MRKYLLVLVLLLYSLTGCAIKPIDSTQTSSSLVVSLSGTTTNKYTLVDTKGNIIAEDDGEDGILSFGIPASVNTTNCVYVIDNKGKMLGDNCYGLPLIHQYQQLNRYKAHIESKYNYQVKKNSDLNKKYQNAKIKLEGHSAFSDRRCHLPDQRPLPPMPITRCESYEECLEEGGAICYSRFIGAEGCAMALKELNVYGMLSSPACAAIAADLAGEKYNMDDAFVDFLHGVADDIGGNLLESESWVDKGVGFLVLLGNYSIKLDKARTCTNNFVQHYYGPKMVWEQRVNEIKMEPRTIKSNCEKLIVEHNRYFDALNNSNKNLQSIRGKLVDIGVVHDELSSRVSVTPNYDNSSSISSIYRTDFVKRYLIGAVIENSKRDGLSSNSGVIVKSLIDNSPAKLSGIQKEDTILRINDIAVSNSMELIREVQRSQGHPLLITFLHDNNRQTIEITPTYKKIYLSD